MQTQLYRVHTPHMYKLTPRKERLHTQANNSPQRLRIIERKLAKEFDPNPRATSCIVLGSNVELQLSPKSIREKRAQGQLLLAKP